ncbi:hypothetical protein PRSY57_1229300, partial [Plasmodium reichenowi]
MKKNKIREKYIKILFDKIDDEKIQKDLEFSNYNYNYNSFIKHDIYYLNKKFYKVKNINDITIKKTLLLYLYKHNFYMPKIIKRLIFKKLLLQNENNENFNYNIYLLLSYLKNPNIIEATQKIIDLDVFRTRINKENEKTIYFFNLFLNYACSHFQFKYKQGLNEVL